MKKFYTTLLMIAAMAGVAVAQENVQTMTLNDIITTGQLSEFYTIENDLIGVYAPPHYPRVIFAKDANEYANRSEPTKEQYNANPRRLYDERNGFFETYEDEFGYTVERWVGTFDQSNWVKIALPEGADAKYLEGRIIKGGTVTGRSNLQAFPSDPLGLTISLKDDAPLPVAGEEVAYEPNLYCCGNFVKQDSWYFVKPQNQEYANIHWAVWHAADTMFYAPKNNTGLPGSFPISMSLWEPQPNISPFDVFEDGLQYEFPAMIEFRLGVNFGLIIDPGFDGDIIIWGDGNYNAPRRMDVTDNPGVRPTYVDSEGGVYIYTVIVYPLRLSEPGILTGVDENVQAVKTLVNTQYVDLQGRVSDKPFEGLNIVRKTFSDGSVTTMKAIKNS
jgi:hypothetical protein